MSYKSQGFTLVEIAIVLVIVGLLLGGLLKGQQVLAGARLQSMIKQHTAVQAAYHAFRDRYRQVPGDMQNDRARSLIGAGINSGAQYGGDGNGRIDEGNFGEASAVWHHLAVAGFIPGGFVGGTTAAAEYQTGTVAPANPYNGAVLLAELDEYLDVLAAPPLRLAYVFGSNVPVDILRELDMKLDDGLPATGAVRATVPGAVGADSFGEVARSDAACISGTGRDASWAVGSGAGHCTAVYLY